MDPISILSLLSTATSLITGKSLAGTVVKGVEELLGIDSADGNNFAGLLNATQSSLNVTPQGGTEGFSAQGAVSSLTSANSGAAVTDETLQSLNELLGTSDSDVEEETDTLSQTNTGILGNTKLDDPFGIKAAEANGSPIAVIPPLVAADSGNIVNEDGEIIEAPFAQKTAPAATSAIDPQNLIQQSATPEHNKLEEKNKLADLGAKTDNNVKHFLDDQATSNNDKILQAKEAASNGLTGQSDKFSNKINNNNHNPAIAAFMAHDIDPRTIGDAARAVRGKDDLKDKLATIDTYKVVSVSKRDNVIDLRLDPAQLGKVQIKFDFTDGKTNIAVFADRPETLDLLQKDTKSIQKILTDNGIQSDSNSMSFNLSQQQKQPGGNGDFNFFSGKPLSFRVEQEALQAAANLNESDYGYSQYGTAAGNGLLNIIV